MPSSARLREIAAFHDLYLEAPATNVTDKRAGIAAITPEMEDCWVALGEAIDELHAASAVLNVGLVDYDVEKESQRVYDDMPLSAV